LSVYDPRGCEAMLLEQLLHKLLCALGIAPHLHEEAQLLALFIDGPPQPILLAVHADHHHVGVPVVTGPGTQAPQACGDGGTEFQKPAPCRLVGHVDTALRQDLLDVAL